MNKLKLITVLLVLTACSNDSKEDHKEVIENISDDIVVDSTDLNPLDLVVEVKDELTLDDGLIIKWFEHGEGETLSYGDMVAVDYKVLLNDGEMIDGNEIISKESIPFLIGFGMQTPGWDIALQQLKVGDFVEIYIPSKLARGERAVEGLFPANSDNILKIRIIEKVVPTREVDGNKVWLLEEIKKADVFFGEDNKISFHTMAFTPSNPVYINTFRTKKPFSMRLEDSGLVPGLKKALINAKRGDRMYIFVPSEEAYKDKGYLDIVKPNEDLFYNVLVLNVVKE